MQTLAANVPSENSTPESAATPPLPAPEVSRPVQKAFSCVLCAQRKVKCDKAPGGCANCTKARVECIYKAPLPPRRRKRGQREIDANVRLRVYEKALKERGVDVEELVKQEVEKPATKSESATGLDGGGEKKVGKVGTGVLVAEGGKSRYLENALWATLQSEFRDPKMILDDSSEEEDQDRDVVEGRVNVWGGDALLGSSLLDGPRAPASLREYHPNPGQIFKLWQVYLDNINPLIKVFHAPSVQQMISNASANLDNVPKNVECLMFGIYCTAVESLGNTECSDILGSPKDIVSQRLKTACHLALIRSSFLKTSDPMVLQALVLFITSLVNFDGRVIWILTGVSARIGQRIGLHRDPETLGLPPFECEMRRRLWYQITMQDAFAEKLAGTGGVTFFGDVKRPLNLNDSDLSPDMKELPYEHQGATEMMFFLMRCHVGDFLQHFRSPSTTYDGAWGKISGNAATLAAKDKAIDDLEAVYQRKFLDYCDSSIPWHFLCTQLSKAVVAMIRFVAHCPSTDAELPQSEKDRLFEWSFSVVQWQISAYKIKEMQGFLWHINSHFQWKAFVYFVSALKNRTQGPDVDFAWREVQTVFDFHPNFSTQASRQALPIAVATLTLGSWDAYVAARGVPRGGEPYFIHVLRARKAKERSRLDSKQNIVRTKPDQQRTAYAGEPSAQSGAFTQPQNATSTIPYTGPIDSFQWDLNAANTLNYPQLGDFDIPMEEDQLNWSNWDNVMLNFELQKAKGFTMEGDGFMHSAYGQYLGEY